MSGYADDAIDSVSDGQIEKRYENPVKPFQAKPIVRQEFAFASHSTSPFLNSAAKTPTAVVPLYCIKRRTKKKHFK